RRNPKLARKIIVPASLKWQGRDKLDQMNLSERVMYPGLDGLSLLLKRWDSAKNPHASTTAAASVAPAPRRPAAHLIGRGSTTRGRASPTLIRSRKIAYKGGRRRHISKRT